MDSTPAVVDRIDILESHVVELALDLGSAGQIVIDHDAGPERGSDGVCKVVPFGPRRIGVQAGEDRGTCQRQWDTLRD